MEKEIQFSLEKKQEAVLQKQRQKEMMAIERTEAQRKVSFALAIGLILVVGLLIYSIYLYRQRNASQKSLLNLTEQNAEMSRKMAEQEVFALIGEVSASVAHDLNTPLGAIKAGTENINAVLVTIVNELIGKCSEAQFRRSLELAAQRPLELFIGGLQIRKESNLMYEYLLADKAHLLSDSDAKEMAVQLTQARIGLSDVALIHEILEATNSKDFIRLIIQAQNLVSFLGTVTDSAERAYEVVQNIREQIQGSSHLEMNKVNLKENIEDVVKTFNHFFKSDYSLRLNVEDSVYILGDSVKLYQLWSNLLKNAIEASPKNETIEIYSTQMDGVVSVHIINKGERIPEDVISKIFDRFYTTKKAKNGTGLGLAIVKKVAEIHNAKMDVQSTEEKTEFIISLKIVV